MNSKISIVLRFLLISGFALTLFAAVPAGAAYLRSPDGLTSPTGWLAFRPPLPGFLAIQVPPLADSTTDEGGDTATISMYLDSVPEFDVTIPVSSLDPTEGTVSPNQLVFTPDNYGTQQDIIVTGQPDAIADGNVDYTIQLGPATSEDTNYDGADPDDIILTNNDDADTAGVTVTPTSGLITTEATGDVEPTFTVVLTSQPTADDVTIGVSSSNIDEGTVSPASLIFTTSNWGSPQTVTVTGVDDIIDDGDVPYTINIANPTGSDSTYNAIDPVDVSVTNLDDTDAAGITVTPTSGLTTTEATGDVEPTFTVVLNTQPKGTVTIPLSSSDTSEGTVSPASLTFNGGDWDTPQTVTVTGVGDAIDDGDILYTIVTAPAESPGNSDYDGLNAADVSITNTDDDTAGFTITPTSGLVTSETGTTTFFTVVLTSQPTADVRLNLSSSVITEGTIDKELLTFTTANWNIAQTVTITGVDDEIIDGPIAYQIITDQASSSDAKYTLINPADVSVTNQDDDVAKIIVDPTSGLSTREDGLTDTFTVVLDTEPSADVSLTLESSDTTEGTVSPGLLTFTPANWETAQTVTVTGVDDNLADGPIKYSIITSASSDDDNYDGIYIDVINITNSDNDTVGFVITPGTIEFPLYTSEGQSTAIISILLNTQPTADVVFTFASQDITEGTFFLADPDKPKTVTFTPENWSAVQEIQLIGVDDQEVDGPVDYSVHVESSSDDPDYHSKSQELSAVNKDAPSIKWVSPELPDGFLYYEVFDLDPILMAVEPISSEPIEFVRFYRWDPELGIYKDIGIDENPPYQFYVYPQDLDLEWNQIYAVAYGNAGIQSKHELFLIYRLLRVYLPSVKK